MKTIVVLTGAGISSESGIQTFRDANGLWEGHDVMEVASPQGFHKNPELVLDFYNQRRRQVLSVKPNRAHLNLKKLEETFTVQIITQNVDDLHERAKSTNVLHLHGELLNVRSTVNPSLVYHWKKDLVCGDLCEERSQLRPHIVWFGEEVPLLNKAAEMTMNADIVVIIGTSMQVYPAASLIEYAASGTPIYFIDPSPTIKAHQYSNLTIISAIASTGTNKLLQLLRS